MKKKDQFTKFCRNCGAEIPRDSKFCEECGTELGLASSVSARPAKRHLGAVVAAVVIVTLIVGAAFIYYIAPPSTRITPSTPTAAYSEQIVKKIAVVSDIGGRGDLSYNDMAFKGGREAERDFGVTMIELISNSEADYVPNLETAAKDPDIILVIGVGILLNDAIEEVASRYPDKDFAIIDGFVSGMPNVMNVVYEEHEGSAVVGALAALTAAYYGSPHIGMVLGIEFPLQWKYEIGYKWGADWALKWYQTRFGKSAPVIGDTPVRYRVLWTYTGTFNDTTRGYEAAKAIFAMGGVAVYNAGGPLGLGINQAVQEIATSKGLSTGPPFWIGLDSDQDWINPGFILASMMKRIDRGVHLAIQLAVEGKFRQVVAQNKGMVTIGIGTTISGIPTQGISVSTLADLDEFIQMGLDTEKLIGKKVLPMTPDETKTKVKAMRDSLPSWLWDAENELENAIRADPNLVPLATTAEAVDQWRAILG